MYRVDEQLKELMKLPAQFTALKRYKKEMLEMLRGKAMDHEKRVTELEASHAELRANNDRDHQKMTINIHNNKVQTTRDAEQIAKIWDELNRYKDMSVKWNQLALQGDAIKA